MTGESTKEYVRWAVIAITGSIGLYSLILLGWSLVQTFSGSNSLAMLAFILVGTLLVPVPLLLIAHGFLTRQYEVAVSMSALLAAIFAYAFLMNIEHQVHLIKWVEWLAGGGKANQPDDRWMFVRSLGSFALAIMGFFLPLICAEKVYRYCRKLGSRWFGLPSASPKIHAV